MRPTALAVRSLAALLLAVGTAACADMPTQSAGVGLRRPRMSTADARDARLLVCPTAEPASARALIGAEGGTLGARGTSITIPAGAVAVPTLFEVVVPASEYMEVDIHAVGQSEYTFLQPTTITLNFARCPADAVPTGATLDGVYIESGTRRVLERMGGTADKSGHKVTFSTGHLSGYAVAY